jgi:hypothetical protein
MTVRYLVGISYPPEVPLRSPRGWPAVRKIEDRDTLKSLLDHITPAATKDRDAVVRDYAGRALHHIQQVLKEEKKPSAPAATKGTT